MSRLFDRPVDGDDIAVTPPDPPDAPEPEVLPQQQDPAVVDRSPDDFTEEELADDGERPVPLVPEAEPEEPVREVPEPDQP